MAVRRATDPPTVGDWDGNGSDTIGVYRSGMFYLRNDLTSGPAESSVAFGDTGTSRSGAWQSAR